MTDDFPASPEVSWPAMQTALAEAPALVLATSGPDHQPVYANDAYRRLYGLEGLGPRAQRTSGSTRSA